MNVILIETEEQLLEYFGKPTDNSMYMEPMQMLYCVRMNEENNMILDKIEEYIMPKTDIYHEEHPLHHLVLLEEERIAEEIEHIEAWVGSL